MEIQLSRIFGENSKEVLNNPKSEKDWKRTLRKVLDELYEYIEDNIESDELHTLMIYTCLYASHESLKEENFWPGYIEGITRLSFLLMGDYPDHRKRKVGKKKKDHYKLNLHRSVIYSQDSDQKVRTLYAAGCSGLINLSESPNSILSKFRCEVGFSADYKQFMKWFKKNYQQDYAKLF